MSNGKNLEYFNTMVGLIFEQIYSEFPIPIDIDERAIAEAMGIGVIDSTPANVPVDGIRTINFDMLPNGVPFRKVLYPTLKWLQSEGFITSAGSQASHNVVLTAKALLAMNASPDVLGPSLGQKLTGVVKGAGTEGGRAVIAETVGQIMGAVMKSMTGGN